MSDRQNSGNPQNLPSSSSSSSTGKPPSELKNGSLNAHTSGRYSGQKVHYPNPPEASNPDPATLREQWRFAIKQYSRWYSHAWGTAILAGISFFALGWIIKGSNPLPSFKTDKSPSSSSSSSSSSNDASEARR